MNPVGLLIVLVAVAFAQQASGEPLDMTSHPIRNFAIASTERQFGTLEFLGGVELISRDRRFGGISGIEVVGDGERAILVSDDGFVITGDLRHEDGLVTGFENADIERVFEGGDTAKRDNDIEDFILDESDPGRGLMVMERSAEPLMTFSFDGARLGPFETFAFNGDERIFRSNRGLESVAIFPAAPAAAGKVVVIAEDSRVRNGDRIPGWIIGSGRFEIVKRDAFNVSSARFLPGGDLLLLERRYSPGWGVGMRLRRIPGDLVKAGAELDGEVLIEGGLLNQIDNMEGLSVHQDAAGRTVLTLISDDNKNILQRTVLLQFALEG